MVATQAESLGQETILEIMRQHGPEEMQTPMVCPYRIHLLITRWYFDD